MKTPKPQYAFYLTSTFVLAIVLLRGWDTIVNFFGIVLTAIIPLVLGICIAYVVSIPTAYLERHLFPDAKNNVLKSIRKPLALVVSAALMILILILLVLILAPALVDTAITARDGLQGFLESLMGYEILAPYRASIQAFLDGDLMESLYDIDMESIFNSVLGGTMSELSNHVFTFVSMLMTGFFGLLFSVILLTDPTDTFGSLMNVALVYLGPERTEKLAVVLGVADISFHNFIVRQCTEASILGLSAFLSLFCMGHPHATGAAALMGTCALIPIVGYPVGLCASAIVVAVTSAKLSYAVIFVACVVFAQFMEATFVLPHIGDPRTVLSPVWTTVGVTIGGGVAGFIGMLIAIPTCATIHQLIRIDMKARGAEMAAVQDAEIERMINNVMRNQRTTSLQGTEQTGEPGGTPVVIDVTNEDAGDAQEGVQG